MPPFSYVYRLTAEKTVRGRPFPAAGSKRPDQFSSAGAGPAREPGRPGPGRDHVCNFDRRLPFRSNSSLVILGQSPCPVIIFLHRRKSNRENTQVRRKFAPRFLSRAAGRRWGMRPRARHKMPPQESRFLGRFYLFRHSYPSKTFLAQRTGLAAGPRLPVPETGGKPCGLPEIKGVYSGRSKIRAGWVGPEERGDMARKAEPRL